MSVSILFDDGGGAGRLAEEAPAYFRDLSLDAVVDAVVAGRDEYDLRRFYYSPLNDAAQIEYRQEAMRDLEDATALKAVKEFASGMRSVRELRARADRWPDHQGESWFLDSAGEYCATVAALLSGLESSRLLSRAMKEFRKYLKAYGESPDFGSLRKEIADLQEALGSVRYCIDIKGRTVRVRRYEGEEDYRGEIDGIFEKFRHGEGRDYTYRFLESREMNSVEADIVVLVARLFPEPFGELTGFRERRASYMDEAVSRFDREAQFYVAYIDYIDRLRRLGLRFCLPTVTAATKEIRCDGCFDIALAYDLANEDRAVVTNDFYLEGHERVIVVTGPNQGGKTTFGRAFGQLHYLARLGLPVPGSSARLFLCDGIFTHFEREERTDSLRGKLQDDLLRLREILDLATTNSVIVLNEAFTSTALDDAIFLGEKIIGKIMELDALCICVSFLDELAGLGEKAVSMMCEVDGGDAATRTYKIVRKPPDGLAYALSIAEKHRLTYDSVVRRIRT